MNTLPGLIANGLEDVIGFVVFIVIAIAIWAFQAFGKMVQKGRPQRPQRRPQQQPAPGGGLQDEIGEFLRNAAQRRQQQRQPPQQGPGERAARAEVLGGQDPVRAEVLRERAREAARRQAAAGPTRQRTPPYGPQPAEVQRPAEQPAVLRNAPQPKDVVPRLEPASEASRIALASVFAAAGPDTTSGGAAPAAATVYAMLSEPRSLRQAIVLAEILSRPEDRW